MFLSNQINFHSLPMLFSMGYGSFLRLQRSKFASGFFIFNILLCHPFDLKTIKKKVFPLFTKPCVQCMLFFSFMNTSMIQHKLLDELSSNFLELFFKGKYVKLRFECKLPPYFFSQFYRSNDQKVYKFWAKDIVFYIHG